VPPAAASAVPAAPAQAPTQAGLQIAKQKVVIFLILSDYKGSRRINMRNFVSAKASKSMRAVFLCACILARISADTITIDGRDVEVYLPSAANCSSALPLVISVSLPIVNAYSYAELLRLPSSCMHGGLLRRIRSMSISSCRDSLSQNASRWHIHRDRCEQRCPLAWLDFPGTLGAAVRTRARSKSMM
jgi:hypothetical protein